jgi:peptidylprolyl isomerase
MYVKMMIAALAGLFLSGGAAAQPAPVAAPAADAAVVPSLQPENAWHLDLSTGGRVTIQLRPDVAPAHVERIRTLTRQGFYNGLTFHRVIEGFMAQSGDPAGTGAGGSELPDLTAEFNALPHLRGAVAMARTAEPNSANSQFYIMLVPRFSLDRQYTVFGRVVSGMSFVDALQRGEPPGNPSRIVRASIGSDNVAQLPAEQLRAAAQPQAPPAPPPGILPPPR